MSDPDRPPVGRRVLEQIELLQYQVDRQFWPMVASYRVVPSDIAKLALPPPKTPMTLLDSLRAYASMLFKREADQYGQFIGDRNYAPWLAKVEERVIARVFRTLAAIEQEKKPATHAYHGLADDEISQELGQILFEIRNSYIWTDTVRLAQSLSPPLPPDVQAQMEATSPDDPKTWPLLRQKVAAFVEIKKLMEGPKLEIPERLVRETLAEQFGIRPEEVTFEQIRFEVSGLLPWYPAISVLPSEAIPPSTSTPAARQATIPDIATELGRLLREARLRPEDIAEEIKIEPRNVYRHLAGETEPSIVNVGKYEKALSARLGRRVTLPTSVKRQRVIKTSLKRQ